MSQARTAANRRNAQASTGPITDAGKARSARNSTKHGLTSAAVVLPNESAEEFERLRDNIIESSAPGSDHERALALVVAETFWRRQRMYRLESAFMAARMEVLSQDSGVGGDAALVNMFTDPAEMNRARLLLRYVTAAERAYKNAVADLQRVQAERLAAESSAEEDAVTSAATEESDDFVMNAMLARLEATPPQSASAIDGFVSHTGSESS